MRDELGLSINGLRRRWLMPGERAGTAAAPSSGRRTSSTGRRSSARDRFTVINPTDPAPPASSHKEDDPA
jgi:hypothetical protein